MNEQELQDVADQIGDEVKAKPERHWHLANLVSGVMDTNVAIPAEPKLATKVVAKTLMICYRQSLKDLKRLSREFIPDSSEVGQAYLRWDRLDELTDALDPKLFDHPMFKLNTNMDSLVEALEDTLESLGVVEVTGDVSLEVYFCEEQCPELTELQETKQEHGKHGHAFVLPFARGEGPVNLADLLEACLPGVEEMFKAAGIRVDEREVPLVEDGQGCPQEPHTH